MNIADYLVQSEPVGWVKFPNFVETPAGYVAAEHPPESCAYLRERDGIHFMATIRNFGVLSVIHISIGPVKYYRPKDESSEDLEEYLVEVSPEVAQTFFGDRQFARQPNDTRKPDVKHYFSVLE